MFKVRVYYSSTEEDDLLFLPRIPIKGDRIDIPKGVFDVEWVRVYGYTTNVTDSNLIVACIKVKIFMEK